MNSKDRRRHYIEFVYWTILIITMTVLIIDMFLESEQIIIERYVDEESYGGAKTRSKITLYKFLVSHFGKYGLIGLGIIHIFIFLFALRYTVVRYKKARHFKNLVYEGLVSQYDDPEKYSREKSLWQRLLSFFKKDKSKRKKVYPSEKEMREVLKKNKYYKE